MAGEKTTRDVEAFWDSNPLFSGEAETDDLAAFFEKHDAAYRDDVFAGIDYETRFFLPEPGDKVLDVGCGVGFWCALFERRGVTDLTAVDISAKSIEIARQRTAHTRFVHANCEALPLPDGAFGFVNCHGVVHHTPDTQQALNEIFRVLDPKGGRASVSVYYENAILRAFPILAPVIRGVFRLFGRDTGRGRDFGRSLDKDEIVRLYDGAGNPIGKCYSRRDFVAMLEKAGFENPEIEYYFFPFRFLSLPVPAMLKPLLVRLFPFMIIANLTRAGDAQSVL